MTYFSCRFQSGIDYETREELFLPINLTDVILNYHHVSFDEIEKFLSKISHKLQRLRLIFFKYQHWFCKNDDFEGIFYSTHPYRLDN